MYVGGIDPGKRGAIVALDPYSSKAWWQKLQYDSEGILTTRINTSQMHRIVIEDIHGRGGWGANSVFKMGFYFGQIMYQVHESRIPYERVKPTEWTGWAHREVADLKGKGNGKAKDKSKAAYRILAPHDPINARVREGNKEYHDGLIDAFLIAVYSILSTGGPLQEWEFLNDVEAFKC